MQGNVKRISSSCFGNNLELSFVSIFYMHLGLVAFFIPSLGYLYSARWLPWWTSRTRPFLLGHAQQQPVTARQLAARDSARCQWRAGVDGIDDMLGVGAMKVDARAMLISRFMSLFFLRETGGCAPYCAFIKIKQFLQGVSRNKENYKKISKITHMLLAIGQTNRMNYSLL
jgi:hypothetical protein